MVVGNGLIARKLSGYQQDDSVVVFASGVSNSGTKDLSAYRREVDTLLAHKGTEARLVYFSTCSMFDACSSETMYVKHKISMEKLVAGTFRNHLIVRLPLLISDAPNPFTFFNFIVDSIRKGRPIRVQKNAWRYIFDADELPVFLPLVLSREGKPGQTINMAYSNAASVPELISICEEVLEQKTEKILVSEGCYYEFDNNLFNTFLSAGSRPFDKEVYNREVIKKYLLKS